MYKLRTIDVWDTLLRRDCHPECIKLATAQHLFLGWFDQLKPEFRDCWTLYGARIDAERNLAEKARSHGRDDEYEITQVMAHWTECVLSGPVSGQLPARLAEFELVTEIARSFADPEISEFLRPHIAERTLFLSDFYMNANMLGRLISAKGYSELVADGISSCDIGFNKRSGQIFGYIHSHYGVRPEDHVHVGDNQWSDVESPRSLGITALHYVPEIAHGERLVREGLFSSREALFEHVRGECSALAKTASSGLSEKQAAAFCLGAEAAPLFIGFANWIAEQAILEKLDRLFFLTREGEFFHQIFLTLFPDGTILGHDLPGSGVLAVSRLATFSPSMREISIDEMSRIWSLFKQQSVSGLFTTFGLNVENFSELLTSVGLNGADVISDPGSNEALKKLFRSQVFVDSVKHSVSNQQDLLRSYLTQNGMGAGERVGVVDIGWRGTIQDNIALFEPQTHIHGMYLGLRRVINEQPANVSKSAYGPNENISNTFVGCFENFAAMEMLCNSSNGSVVGYSREADQTIPQRHIDEEENAAFGKFARHFQDGVLLATKHWRPWIERYAVSSGDLHGTAMHIWDTLRRVPGNDLADAFLQSPQHDFFGYGEVFKRNQYPSLGTILLAPFLAVKRRHLIEFVRRVQWSEAIERAKDIGPFHRSVLIMIFRIANIFKRARMRARFARKNGN